MRSASKNMCSVRHRPMPSAPNSRATLASWGVSALVRTLMRAELVHPRHDGAEVSGQAAAGTVGTWPQHHFAGGAVQGDQIALPDDRRPFLAVHCSGIVIDLDVAAAGNAAFAHAARHDGGVGGHAAAGGQDALGGIHAVDVFGRGFDPNQDDFSPEFGSMLRPRRR